MRILKFGTVSVDYERRRGRPCLVVSDFHVHCEGAGYAEDGFGRVDTRDVRYQCDLLHEILLNIIEGNYDPGIVRSREAAGAAIERVRGTKVQAPRRETWWQGFWRGFLGVWR
jgi:hypothetical protein